MDVTGSNTPTWACQGEGERVTEAALIFFFYYCSFIPIFLGAFFGMIMMMASVYVYGGCPDMVGRLLFEALGFNETCTHMIPTPALLWSSNVLLCVI